MKRLSFGVMEVQKGLARVPWRTGALHLLSARAWNCFLMGFSATWPPPVRRPSGEIVPAEGRANQPATQPQRTTLGPANATDLRLCSVDRPTLGGTRSRQGCGLIPQPPRARRNQRPAATDSVSAEKMAVGDAERTAATSWTVHIQ